MKDPVVARITQTVLVNAGAGNEAEVDVDVEVHASDLFTPYQRMIEGFFEASQSVCIRLPSAMRRSLEARAPECPDGVSGVVRAALDAFFKEAA